MITGILILVGLILIFIGCGWWCNDDCSDAPAVICVGAFIVFLVLVILIPCFQFSNRVWIVSYKAAQSTLQQSRNDKHINPLELAAIQQKVLKLNRELATNKYYANMPFVAMYWPSEILKLKYLK